MNLRLKGLRFYPWNAAGWLAWYIGHGLYDLGLWLCGLAGSLDGKADNHR